MDSSLQTWPLGAPFSPCPSVIRSQSVRAGHVKSQEGLFLPLDPTDRGADPPARDAGRRRRRRGQSGAAGSSSRAPRRSMCSHPWNGIAGAGQSREGGGAGRSMEPGWKLLRFDSGFVSSARTYVDCPTPTCPRFDLGLRSYFEVLTLKFSTCMH